MGCEGDRDGSGFTNLKRPSRQVWRKLSQSQQQAGCDQGEGDQRVLQITPEILEDNVLETYYSVEIVSEKTDTQQVSLDLPPGLPNGSLV